MFEIVFFGNGAINKLQSVLLRDEKPFVPKGQAMGDGELFEIAAAGITDFCGMNLKISGAGRGERFFNGGLQILLQCQPCCFGHDQSAQHKNRLDGVSQVRAGLARFIQINQVHD